MIIDCDSCAARPAACGDCVVSVLLGPPRYAEHDPAAGGDVPDPTGAAGGMVAGPAPSTDGGLELDATERRAIAALAAGGLVPPLRLVPVGPPGDRRAASGVRPTTRRTGTG